MVMRRVGGQPRMEAIAEEGGRYGDMDAWIVVQWSRRWGSSRAIYNNKDMRGDR